MGWKERIHTAKCRSAFDAQDIMDAMSWEKCAVYEVTGRIPAVSQEPLLYALGHDFYKAVHHQQFDDALIILQSIMDWNEDDEPELQEEIKR